MNVSRFESDPPGDRDDLVLVLNEELSRLPERYQSALLACELVARKDLAATPIRRLLEVVFNSPFSQVLQPPLDARLLESPPELTWHDGTTEYIRRNSPLITGDVIDLVEKEVSILGVLVGGQFCLLQWLRRRFRRRRERSFEAYILQVARVERRRWIYRGRRPSTSRRCCSSKRN